MVSQDDRVAILDLCARYNWFTDTGQAEQVAALFVPEGVFDGVPGRFEGTAEIVGFKRNSRQVIAGSVHTNDNHLFEDAEDHVKHRCFCVLHRVPSDDGLITMFFTYDDEIAKVDGTWKFRLRVVRPFEGDKQAAT